MKKALLAASVVALSVGGLAPVGLTAAGADPVDNAFASAFGANLDVLGTPAVDQGGLATAGVPQPIWSPAYVTRLLLATILKWMARSRSNTAFTRFIISTWAASVPATVLLPTRVAYSLVAARANL